MKTSGCPIATTRRRPSIMLILGHRAWTEAEWAKQFRVSVSNQNMPQQFVFATFIGHIIVYNVLLRVA